MAVAAKIKFVQGMSTPPAGEALIGVVGVPVTASNEDSSNVETMEWEWVDAPPTSSIVPGIAYFGAPQDLIFLPDQSGGYLLHLTVVDAAGNRADSYLVFQVAEVGGYIIPPFQASAPMVNFGGQKRGWAKYLEILLRALIAAMGGGGTVTDVTGTAPIVSSGGATPDISYVPLSGVTGSRPGAPAVGEPYFDTTLVAPIWWNGAAWITASGGLSYAERSIFASNASTPNDSGSPLVLGTFKLDPNIWPATIGALTRVVKLKATLYTDNVAGAPVCKLRDLTGVVDVATITPAASTTPDEFEATLTVGNAAGNLRNDVVHVYEARLYRSGGTGVENVKCGNVRMDVTYI